MTDLLLQVGLSNACVALGLAIVATLAGIAAKRPQLANLLWLLVLVKLVTPPIVTIPVVTIPGQPETALAAAGRPQPGGPIAGGHGAGASRARAPAPGARRFDGPGSAPTRADSREPVPAERTWASLSARIAAAALALGKRWLPPTWLLGSAIVLVWSLARVRRFGRLLKAECQVAPRQVREAAGENARRLGLSAVPAICTTTARLSPMVWWAGGKVRIVMPTALLERLDARQWRWVLAHELAHVRRRDHLVRWIEWLACVCFWWNPVMWWARHGLRASEELCCDELVLSGLKPKPRSYAQSLLTAIECIAGTALRPPAVASEINRGQFLERRFRMIVSATPGRMSSRWLRACALLCGLAVLPLGVAYSQDHEAVGKRLNAAVKEGEVTREQAATMMVALKKAEAAEQPEPKEKASIGGLLAAAKDGDAAAIKRHLAAGVKVDAKDQSHVTALFVAAVFGRADAANLLMENGADIKAAKGDDGSTALHAAAFFCHTDVVKLLLAKGADINAVNQRSETPLDTVAGPWSKELGEFYAGIAKAIDLKLDLKEVKATRPKIAALLRKRGGKTARKPAPTLKDIAARGIRCSYYKNGRIHVGVLGEPDGKPLTVPPGKGWEDFKPSWSKTGDMLVFFRRVKNDPVVTNWKTAICIINVDGTGFHQLTDGTHTDFNQTWTRDGTNTPIWNRRNTETGGFYVMASKVGNKPGQEIALTDKRYHTWAYSCLTDGRILVQCAHPTRGWGYFLMTPNAGGEPRYERIDCELAKQGLLDRISVSPSETKVCFEHQLGFKYKDPGRTLYIADFDAKKRTMTNFKAFANKDRKPIWFAYPRWTKGEAAVVYHSYETGRGGLYLYTLKDGSTVRVSTNPNGDYRYPHGERMPK